MFKVTVPVKCITLNPTFLGILIIRDKIPNEPYTYSVTSVLHCITDTVTFPI